MAYRGQVAHIPLGQMGLLTDVPAGDVPRGALISAYNVSYETGTVTKAPGAIRYNTNALPAGVVGHVDWWPNPSTQRLIAACSNGSIYRDIGDKLFSGNVAIASGLGTLTPKCMFVEGGQETAGRPRKLFFFSGTAQLQVLEGDDDEFTPVTAPASDWVTPNFPKFGFIHRNRLWSFVGQRAYASDTADHENNTSNNLTQNIFPGEGGDLIGGHVFKGRAFVFKDGGFVYYLDDSDTDSDNWNWRKLASNFGLASPNGICEIINDMIAVNQPGSPISYNATNALGDIESADILRMLQIEDYFRSITSRNGLDVLHSMYYEAKKQAFFTWRSGHRITNDRLLHIDFNKPNPRASVWTKDQADSLALRKDLDKIDRPTYGSADGFIYLMDREDRVTGNDVGYTGIMKIGHTDFRFLDEKIAHVNKLYDYLSIEFVPTGSWNLTVNVFIDGSYYETITFPMNVRDDGLGNFQLDSGGGSGTTTYTGGDGSPLGREETQTITMPLHGSGRRISFELLNSGERENFSIASLTIGFRVSERQTTRLRF